LRRAHLAAATSLLRLGRWLNGIDIAIEAKNYSLFCAAYRGALEASADSHDVLNTVSATIGAHYQSICLALHGKSIKNHFESKELEDTLIHYSHARKLKKAEKVQFPASHEAKQIKQYLTAIGAVTGNAVDNLYSDLCDVTHPGFSSVQQFISIDNEDDPLVIIALQDAQQISDLCNEYRDVGAVALQMGVNSALLVLGMLNITGNRWLKTESLKVEILDKIPAWPKLRDQILHGLCSSVQVK